MSIQSLYNSTAFIFSPNYTEEAYGNTTITYALCSEGFDCYVTYLGGQEQVFAGKENVVCTHRLFCDPRTMSTADRIYIQELDQYFNVRYIDNCNRQSHHVEVLLELVEGPQTISIGSNGMPIVPIWSPTDWNSTYSTVNANSGCWSLGCSSYSLIRANSAIWMLSGSNVDLGQIPALSSNWNTAYTNLVTNSAAYLTSVNLGQIPTLSGNWNSTYTTVNSNSATWQLALTAEVDTLNSVMQRGAITQYPITLQGGGVKIEQGLNTAQVDIAGTTLELGQTSNWGGTIWDVNLIPDVGGKARVRGTEILLVDGDGTNLTNVLHPNDLTPIIATSGNWDSTYTTVTAGSASWNATYATVCALSANWDGAYSTTNSNSAYWTKAYTTVQTNSAGWALSGNYLSQEFNAVTSVNITHNFSRYPIVQVMDFVKSVFIPESIIHNTINDFSVTFTIPTSGTVIAIG